MVRALTTEALEVGDLIRHASAVGGLLGDPSHVVRVASQHTMLRGGDAIRDHLIAALEDPERA